MTDIEREIKGADGKQIDRFSALHDIQVPWDGNTWFWDIAPLGEEDAAYSVTNKVLGVSNIAAGSMKSYVG